MYDYNWDISLKRMRRRSAAHRFACFGWDELLFPEMCPFLDGGIFLNAVYLYMATKILPPKQKKLLDDEEMDKLIDEIIAEMAQEEGDFINDVIEEI